MSFWPSRKARLCLAAFISLSCVAAAQTAPPELKVYTSTSLTACPAGEQLEYFYYWTDIPQLRASSWCGAAQADLDWANATESVTWRIPYLLDACTPGVNWFYSHAFPDGSRYHSPAYAGITMVCRVEPELPPLGCQAGAGGFAACPIDGGNLSGNGSPGSASPGTPSGGGLGPNAGAPGGEDQGDTGDTGEGGESCRAEAVGNPIFPGTGNKYQREMDYAGPPGLSLVRHYNSSLPGWTHNFSMRVLTQPKLAAVVRPDGQAQRFSGSGAGEWQAEPGITARLLRLAPIAPGDASWRYIGADDTQEDYDAQGQLLRIQRRGGLVLTAQQQDGLLRSVSDPFGRSLQFTHDAQRRLVRVTTPEGSAIAYGYDARGLVQTHTDARGGVWRYTRDEAGNLASLTDPLARTTRWTHDAAGRVLTQTDPGGLVTTMVYDARGRLLSVSRAGETTRYAYTATGLLASVQQPDGYQVSYRHDAAHRLTGASDNRGASVEFTLDAMGNRIREEVKDGSGQIARVSARVMNAMNRVAALQGAMGQSTQWTYDANGELVAETDPLNQTTRRVLDGLGRRTALGFADNASALFAWNTLDQLTQVTDPKSVRTAYQRNAFGEELAEVSPDIGQLRYQRDADGNVVQVQDARGDTTRIDRDVLGRVRRIGYAPDLVTQIGYDDAGNVSRVVDGSGSTDYVRDALGRVLSRTQVVNDNPSNPSRYATAYSWSGGQLAGMVYPSGLKVFYERSAGRITGISVQEPGRGKAVVPFITDLSHTALGQPRAWHWASGDNASRRFDADGRMVANDFATYAYDAAGRITGITQQLWAREKYDSPYPLPFTWTVGYDSRSRVASFVREGAEARYTYDTNGNRLTSIDKLSGDADLDGDDKDADVSTTQVMQMDAGSNRLLGMSRTTMSMQHGRTHTVSSPVVHTLDANGALTNDGLRRYEYDASRRLSRVRTFQQGDEVAVRYLHNALGQRVFKSEPEDLDLRPPERNGGGGFLEWLLGRLQLLFIGAPSASSLGTAYVYGEGPIPEWALLGEYGNGSAKSRGRTEYLWLPTEDGGAIPVGLYRDGSFYAVHTDHLGTPRLVTGQGGEPVWQWMYSAFGEGEPMGVLKAKSTGKPRAGDKPRLSKTEPAIELNLRFAGQYADEETGLFYNMLRSYNAANGGRYSQADPIGLNGGWNRFGYVESKPLVFVDPMGLAPPKGISRSPHELMPLEGGGGVGFGGPTSGGRSLFGPSSRSGAVQCPDVTFKTDHYSGRLTASGLDVGRVEARVKGEIDAMSNNMVPGAPTQGRLSIDGVRVEYRAMRLPNGQVNVGTIFPVE